MEMKVFSLFLAVGPEKKGLIHTMLNYNRIELKAEFLIHFFIICLSSASFLFVEEFWLFFSTQLGHQGLLFSLVAVPN